MKAESSTSTRPAFGGGDEPVAAVFVSPQDAGEEAHQGLAPYRRALVEPCAVRSDAEGEVSAVGQSGQLLGGGLGG